MSVRYWLSVREARIADFAHADWYEERAPVPEGLAPRDRIAIIGWPNRGPNRSPVLAATASVTAIDTAARKLRLRRRVVAIAGHEVGAAALGAGVAATRGWTPRRRLELLSVLHLIDERDFQRIEEALLEVAYRHGPPPKRPQHSRPRTPGRRALIAGRASVTGTRRGAR